MFFWKDQWNIRMSFAKAGAITLFRKYSCKVTSCQFHLPTQWWVEPVTAQQDGSKARNVLLQQVSSAHPTSPHSIPPKLAGRLSYPTLGSVSLQTSLHSMCAEQRPTQLPSKGSPFSKYTLDLIFSCWFLGEFETRRDL